MVHQVHFHLEHWSPWAGRENVKSGKKNVRLDSRKDDPSTAVMRL